jgi:amidase
VAYTAQWNYTGQPAAAIPAGFDDEGMPLSVQLVVRPGADATLVSLAAQIERATRWGERRPPVS